MIRPHPKPPFPRPNPKRLPERKPVTIVAGFVTKDVMLLCSDMEEGDGGSKKLVKKISHIKGDGWQVDVGGAGASAVLDIAFKRLSKEFTASRSRSDMAHDHEEIIRSVLQGVHEEYIWPSKILDYSIELLLGINFKDSEEFFLYRTQEYIPQPIDSYCCIGVGAVLGNYFASLLHSPTLTRTQMLSEGTFIIREVSEFVSDCGKGIQIELTTKDGEHFSLTDEKIEVTLPNRHYIGNYFWDILEPWEITNDHLRSWESDTVPESTIQTVVWKDFDKHPTLQRAKENAK
jgi:hypothetical protein